MLTLLNIKFYLSKTKFYQKSKLILIKNQILSLLNSNSIKNQSLSKVKFYLYQNFILFLLLII